MVREAVLGLPPVYTEMRKHYTTKAPENINRWVLGPEEPLLVYVVAKVTRTRNL